MGLQVHNSLTGSKETFKSLHEGKASFYVCGPTVYGEAHLGHAKTYVGFDIILRYLKFLGYETFYVQNITDVGHLVGDGDEGEDKLLKKAREAKKEPMAIAEYYTRYHFHVMDQLGVLPPDITPRATGHITEQLSAIQQLVERGFAYEVNGSVYFDVSKDPDYGVLSNRKIEELVEGTRVEVRSEKRNPNDFALWKAAEEGHLMRWPDPWSGWGYPGWHIECSVMSTKYLGDSFDIHGGGMELKFPHHECEIAQARCLGKGFARYWLHSNMLTIDGQKMSKSSGNFVTLSDAFQDYDPLVLRYFIASCHYRSVLDYSHQSIDAAATGLQRLHNTVRELRKRLPEEAAPAQSHFQNYKAQFVQAMDDDFATPQALAVLFELSKEVNTMLSQATPSMEAIIDAEYLFSTLGGDILGVIPETMEAAQNSEVLGQTMEILIDLRNEARAKKDYALSDQIRDRLKAIDIEIKDGKEGSSWELNSSGGDA